MSQQLESDLLKLYQQQLEVGVISQDIHNDIHKLIPIIQDDILKFYIQHNPHRVLRGLAVTPNPTPKHTIQYKGGIPCFLCMDNIQVQWPKEKGLPYTIDDIPLIFLPNLYPIFPLHFTVAADAHLPQVMNIPTLITLAKILPAHWIIQNGEGAGATNPEHFHYQTFLPTNLPHNLPITHYPTRPIIQKNSLQIDRLIHPASIYRFQFKTMEESQAVTTILMEYLDHNPNHRLNILATYCPNKAQWQLMAILRHTDRRTDLYRSGQPGYAEAAGIISTTTESHDRWIQNNLILYTQLMADIATPPESEIHFQTLIHSIISK
jgi:hypothetical protein